MHAVDTVGSVMYSYCFAVNDIRMCMHLQVHMYTHLSS